MKKETHTMETTPEPQIQPEAPARPSERGRGWRIVIIVLALHAGIIGCVLLSQGCSKSEPTTTSELSSPASASEEFKANGDASAQNKSSITLPGSDVLTPEEHLPGADISQSTSPLTVPSDALNSNMGSKSTDITKKEVESAPKEKAKESAPVKPAAAAIKYVVKKGDTLSKIAKKYTLSVTELASANKLTAKSALKLGQKLNIPSGQKTEVAKTAKSGAAPVVAQLKESGATQKVHVVKSGESPASIARHYGVTVQSLMEANNIVDAKKMKVNQKLVIPSPKVASGTTLPLKTPVSNLRTTPTEEPVGAGQKVQGI